MLQLQSHLWFAFAEGTRKNIYGVRLNLGVGSRAYCKIETKRITFDQTASLFNISLIKIARHILESDKNNGAGGGNTFDKQFSGIPIYIRAYLQISMELPKDLAKSVMLVLEWMLWAERRPCLHFNYNFWTPLLWRDLDFLQFDLE